MKLHTEASRAEWRASVDGPWPIVNTHGELERAEAEWLVTNGNGTYAMSTLAEMHTRRQHGLLVAELPSPLGRHVILSQTETTVEVGGRYYRLSTHQFPNVAPTPGYRLLQTFAQDPLPRWVFQLGKATFERRLCLVKGQPTVVLSYTWYGKSPARLWVRPLMPLRPVGALMHEHGAMMQRVVLRSGEVEVQPIPRLPAIAFGHSGVFMGSPDWWRRFEYSVERTNGVDFQEDMWTPGVFEFNLEPEKTAYLVASVASLPSRSPEALFAEAEDAERTRDPGAVHSPAKRTLWVAADPFFVHTSNKPAIVAGYPTLGIQVRDVVMAVSGLLLCRGRIEAAKAVLETVLGTLRGGLLAHTIEQPVTHRAPLPDATLWLFEAARELMARVPPDDPFVKTRLFPALRRVFVRVTSRWHKLVWLSEDGLVANGDMARGLTWMDAHVGSRLVTPRRGLAVEHQALWSKGCETLAALALRYGDPPLAERALAAGDRARAAFRERFWCNQTNFAFDCISEARSHADTWVDPSIRPNALIALAVDPDLFDDNQARSILYRLRSDLLTPRGVRSLALRDPSFVGHFSGTVDEHEAAYHQGTAWPHLLGFYVRAELRIDGSQETKTQLRELVEASLDAALVPGFVSQLADGEPPHRSRGCPAYAVGVSELLRALELLD
jgi:predicted glycogen debranching enzyme